MNHKSFPSEEQKFERCAMCGALTDVPISKPVELRRNYEIGLGQLCMRCAKEMREEDARLEKGSLLHE